MRTAIRVASLVCLAALATPGRQTSGAAQGRPAGTPRAFADDFWLVQARHAAALEDFWRMRARHGAGERARHRGLARAALRPTPGGPEYSLREVRAVYAALADYAAGGGEAEAARALLHEAATRGCRGECLTAVVECMTRALWQGFACGQARDLVAEAVIQELEAPSPTVAGLPGDRLRARVDARLAPR